MVYTPELYIHELDRKAFGALNTFPKLVKLREAYIQNYDEKTAKYTFLSSAIRLSKNQMPEIYSLLPPICCKLGIEVPELYYVKSKEMKAGTGGSTSPYIYVTSALIEKVSNNLVASVLAHYHGRLVTRLRRFPTSLLFSINVLCIGAIWITIQDISQHIIRSVAKLQLKGIYRFSTC